MTKNARLSKANSKAVLIHDTVAYDLKKDGVFSFAKSNQNTGLISYCLEHKANSGSLTLDEVNQLKESIETQAVVDEAGRSWWRWERYPSRPDYLYPIDWDDQLKSMDALSAAVNMYGIDLSVKFPDTNVLVDRIRACFYKDQTIGEDNVLLGPARWAIFMFDRGFSEKMGNKEDIFVSAVILDSGFEHGLFNECAEIANAYERLWVAAEQGLKLGYPFHTLSRCYISWAHYIYLLERINTNYNFGMETQKLVALYQDYLNRRYFDEIEASNWRMDAFFAAMVGVNYSKRKIELLNRFLHVPNTIVYRHRRLNNFYGSAKWDEVLKRRIKRLLG